MGYISSNEDFQTVGAFGCGGNCGCAPCAARRFGNPGLAAAGLAEWYEEDDEPDTETPAKRATNGLNGSAMGEAPERLELQPPSLLQPDPVPAWQRRVQERMSRDLPRLRLDPQFMPPPGRVPVVPPPPPIDLRLPERYRQELWERWERERRNREMFRPLPPPPPTRSLGDAIRSYLDGNLNNLLSTLRIPQPLRAPIRNAARDAIGRGAIELLDRTLTSAGIGGEGREAITNSVRAAIETIRVR